MTRRGFETTQRRAIVAMEDPDGRLDLEAALSRAGVEVVSSTAASSNGMSSAVSPAVTPGAGAATMLGSRSPCGGESGRWAHPAGTPSVSKTARRVMKR